MKALTKDVKFNDEKNIAIMIGGFISYYFGFYNEFKQAQATFTCLPETITTIKDTASSTFNQISTNLNEVMNTCRNTNPLDFIWGVAEQIFKSTNVDEKAAELFKNSGCVDKAKKLVESITSIFDKIKGIFDNFQKCIDSQMANQSQKPTWLTSTLQKAAVAAVTKIASMLSFGITDAVKIGQAALIMIKFAIVCSYTDAEFPAVHKYRVLGKYLAMVLQIALGLSKFSCSNK